MNGPVPYWLRQEIKSWPGILTLQLKVLRPGSANQLATRRSRLCLEGFPRSGNGFALACATRVLGLSHDVIANHTHSTANVRRAAALGLPTYVLLRRPADCCASLILWGASRGVEDGLRAYEAYHRALLPLLDRIAIIPFEELAASPEGLLQRVARDLGLPQPTWDEAMARRVAQGIRVSDERREVSGRRRLSVPDEAAPPPAGGDWSASARLARCEQLHDQILRVAPDLVGAA